jgi:transposase
LFIRASLEAGAVETPSTKEEPQMKLHGNAPFGPKGRATMVRRVVEQKWSLTEAAEAAGVSERTAGKWVDRYRSEGEAGLHDRSSAPHSVPGRTSEDRVAAIAALRRVRMTGPEIAECLGMALSTVSAVLRRIGLGKLSRLEPPEPPNRYERSRPGELIHIDVKKLGRIEKGAGHRATGRRTHHARGAGWEFVHVCVDDATRLAYVEVLGDEKAATAIGFLRLLRRPRHRGRAADDRQRLRLSLDRPLARVQGARDPPHPHPPLPAAHQRQGRALHPHDARRLGLRRDLPRLRPAHRVPIRLAGVL